MKDPRTKAGDRRAPGARRSPTMDGGIVVWGLIALVGLLAVILLSGCERAPQRAEPDPVAMYIVNTQEYTYGDMTPVHYAYTAVAEWRGWTSEQIEHRRDWLVNNVVMLESGGCWMIYGGTLYNAIGDSCWEPAVRGNRGDAGFGQITKAGWGRNGHVCKAEGMCSRQAVTRSAWDSMNAMLSLYEYAEEFPWCWNKAAKRYHSCHLAPSA